MVDTDFVRFIFQDEKVVSFSSKNEDFFCKPIQKSREFYWNDFLNFFLNSDRELLQEKYQRLGKGEIIDPIFCALKPKENDVVCSFYILLDNINYMEREAIQVTLVSSENLNIEDDRFKKETEVMRDVLAALAGTDNIQKTLEVILLNLHDLIQYDRAGLILADEDKRFVITQREETNTDGSSRRYLDEEPILKEVLSNKKVLIIPDIQTDRRFDNWSDLESVHGWLAAPLIVDNEVIGILTLGSLLKNAYDKEDAEIMHIFAGQVAQVLEKAWLSEKRVQRNKDLEVISSISLALGKAEQGENTLDDIVNRVTKFFGAIKGYLLLPDQTESYLKIEVSSDNSLISKQFLIEDDLFGRSIQNRSIEGFGDVKRFLSEYPVDIYRQMFDKAQSAIVIPLLAYEKVFGLLCFPFQDKKWFSDDRSRLANAVADIAGASIHRAVVLNALESQVELRTQHLSTLYEINSIASQPLDLNQILIRILEITLDSLHSRIGAIHFLDEFETNLTLCCQKNFSKEMTEKLSNLSLEIPFWKNLINSSEPFVIQDINDHENITPEILEMVNEKANAFLGVPIQAKGKILGLLSVFCDSISVFSIEDLTLFMTISDQIGGSIERDSLLKQAQIAAVVDERQRMARELHDSVTQLLYSQVLFTGASLRQLSHGNQEQVVQHLNRINEAALQALKEMRLLIYQLQPSDYLKDGLVNALEKRLDSVERRSGIEATVKLDTKLEFDASKELVLYRIAEEALNNTIKHAHASKVDIKIGEKDGHIYLEVIDNGVGFNVVDTENSGGMGLKSMQERAKELGGRLLIDSKTGSGSKIIAEIID
jgi:signal transduction histidine kinase